MRLEELEERLRLITETISEVVWLASYDISRMLYVSPAYERVWMRSCESLYADPRSFLDAIHPDDRARVLSDLQAELEGKAFDHEYRIVLPDGSTRWIWDRGYPVRSADGRVDYYVGVAQDITARKTAELELATLADRIRLVSLATKDGFWDWDMSTGAAWWSDAMFDALGYDRSTTPSYAAWIERVHPEDRDRVMREFDRVIAESRSAWVDEYRLLLPDGKVRDVYDRAYVLYDPAGKPARMIGTTMDTTDRRNLEAQLRHAQKMDAIGQLAGGVAHDFNNILHAILLEADLIRSVPGLPLPAARGLADLRTAAERAANLTRQLLVFGRREQMQPRWLDLNAAIVDLARMLNRILREDIALVLELSPVALWVHADPGMLDQVLVNLAVNARDAMPRGGTLSIATARVDHAIGGREAERYARITVRDTGVGIADDVRGRIFEPFFTTKEAGRGTGLGLAIALGIVEQHRGWIAVETQVGQGAVFTIHLPAGDAPAQSERAQEAAVPSSRGRETILVVEDDAPLRRLVRRVFEREGYRVIEADCAASALDAWDRSRGDVDLVLTDLVMPGGIDGWALVTQLEARRPGLKAVIATGYHGALAGRELGSKHRVLHKPVSAEHLLATVRSALDAR